MTYTGVSIHSKLYSKSLIAAVVTKSGILYHQYPPLLLRIRFHHEECFRVLLMRYVCQILYHRQQSKSELLQILIVIMTNRVNFLYHDIGSGITRGFVNRGRSSKTTPARLYELGSNSENPCNFFFNLEDFISILSFM